MTILAEISGWGLIIEDILLVIHIVVCLLLCLVVLMQRPKQEGLGAAFGGGMTDQAFGARTTDVLQKGTVYLASILFVITLILSVLVSSKSKAASLSDEIKKSGAADLEENVGAAASALDELDAEGKISAEGIAEEVQKATDKGENKPAEETEKSEAEKSEGTPEGKPAGEEKPAPPVEPVPAETTETPVETETPGQ
jgi:preprotein translocase subunit SecG